MLFISIANPSPGGGSLRSRPLLVPAPFPPKLMWGVKRAGLL